MHFLVLVILAVPLAAAIAVAASCATRPALARQVSIFATVLTLLVTALVAVHFSQLQAEDTSGVPQTFQPRLETIYDVLRLGPDKDEAIRFYVGVDGLSIWLIVLTAVLMVPSVLISWNSIQERAHEFYAWLLLLETGMIGVFVAFDILLFYVFFELTLVPLFFLIGIWGGPQRRYAARKFFVYTLAGSLITLLGVLGIVLACYFHGDGHGNHPLTFSIPRLVLIVNESLQNPENASFWGQVEFWVFLALAAGFAVKVPLIPLHTWLPLAHVEAPTAGSVLLAGVLLKIGAYGFLRLCLPLAPDACVAIGVPLIGSLAVIGVVYGALCALAQDDIKKLVAYSSVSHLGLCMLGMFALNATGLSGSLLQMVNHGLSTGALFLMVGMLYDRYHTRMLGDYGGMAARLKVLSFFMVFFCLSSIGLPGLNGFVGEVLVLMGIYDFEMSRGQWPFFAVIGGSGIILGAWYLLTMLARVFFGPVKEPHHADGLVSDLNARELAALIPLAALCIALGVYPQPMLAAAKADIQIVANLVGRAKTRSLEKSASFQSNPVLNPNLALNAAKPQTEIPVFSQRFSAYSQKRFRQISKNVSANYEEVQRKETNHPLCLDLHPALTLLPRCRTTHADIENQP